MLEPGSRMLEPGSRMLEPGSRMLEYGSRMLEYGSRMLEYGSRDPTAVEAKADIPIGSSMDSKRFPGFIISRLSTIPASGAPRTAANPALMPHSFISRRSSSLRWSVSENFRDRAEPIWALGPARPADLPKAMVIIAASRFTRTAR
jgi:hypothetical protein